MTEYAGAIAAGAMIGVPIGYALQRAMWRLRRAAARHRTKVRRRVRAEITRILAMKDAPLRTIAEIQATDRAPQVDTVPPDYVAPECRPHWYRGRHRRRSSLRRLKAYLVRTARQVSSPRSTPGEAVARRYWREVKRHHGWQARPSNRLV